MTLPTENKWRQFLPAGAFNLGSVLFAVMMWLMLLARYGYTFGVGDHVEMLPYILFLKNHALYPHDFFMQGLNQIQPNERTILAYMLLPFSNILQPVLFLLHFLCTVSVILGMENIASRFIKTKLIARFAIFLYFFPFYNWTLGDIELYYNTLEAGNFAKSIAIWGIVSFLDEKFLRAYILIAIATFIQIIVGIDLAIVFSVILLFRYFVHSDVTRRDLLKSFTVYALTAGIFLLLIFFNRPMKSSIPAQEYFDIMFRFRHPHHFIFSYFPLTKRVAFLIFMVAAIYYYCKVNRTVFYFVVFACGILILYIVSVDFLHITFIANFQFYKNTIWLKLLGVIAVVGIIDQRFRVSEISSLMSKRFSFVSMSVSIVLLAALVFKFNYVIPLPISFHFGNQTETDPLISICNEIKKHTPIDAVFVQPFEIDQLKYYSERSSFVDFKANVRDPEHAAEWYQRVQLVYGISLNDKQAGFDLQTKADQYFTEQGAADYDNLKAFGVTNVLTYANVIIPGKAVILQNDFYKVYEL